MDKKIKYRLIIGLGNPGGRYALTYHNAGQLAINFLMKTAAETMTFAKKGKQKNFEYFKFINGDNLIFVKPLTFMNESGGAVAACLKYFRIKPEETLIIHDDSDIELGESKLSFSRGAGGHHGIESIINNLKTKNFWRLRIGIRKKEKEGNKRKGAGEMVLKKITAADNLILEKIIKELKI
ncbi:MAG: aminoacyl-tRNA hydrolase [bacterium]|nr:aminoacyl-tRNA hydrolase [bacterium]